MTACCFYLFKGRGRGGVHSRFEVVRYFSCAEGAGQEALHRGYAGGEVDVHARAAELERRRVLGRRVAAGRLCMPVRRVATGRLHVPVRHAAAEWLNVSIRRVAVDWRWPSACGENGRRSTARDVDGRRPTACGEGSRRPTARGEDGRRPSARGKNGRRPTAVQGGRAGRRGGRAAVRRQGSATCVR